MLVYTDDISHYVAESLDDLQEILREECELEAGTDYELDDWKIVDPEETITIIEDDEVPGCRKTYTAGRWAELNGRGFLCSTEY